MTKLAPILVNQIYEATLKTFWRKNALRRFLRQVGVAKSFVDSWASDGPQIIDLAHFFSPDTGHGSGA